jgi:surface antigen
MLLGALAIDLAMRGFFSKELPPNAFDRPLVLPIEVGMVSIDPLFYTITSHCSGTLGALSKAIVVKDTDKAIEALGKFLICSTEAPVREKIKEWLIKLFSKEVAEKWTSKFVGSLGDFLNLPMRATLMGILAKYTLGAPSESWARIEAVEAEDVAQPQITSSLKITPQKGKYQVGDVLSAEFNIANKGNASITFDVLTVGGRVNDICPNDKCPDFDWKRDVTLKPNETYPYQGKLKLETAGDYHFFTAYRTKDGQWNTNISTAQGVTNILDIKVLDQKDLLCPDGYEYTHPVHSNNLFNKEGACGLKEACRGYCTWYAAERWLWDGNEELLSVGPAYKWAQDAEEKGLYVDLKKPIKGSIMVLGGCRSRNKNEKGECPSWEWGHVAYVDSVNEKQGYFTISQMNGGSDLDLRTLKTECFNKITSDTLSIGINTYKGMKILGYIYPSVEKPPKVDLATALVIDHSGSMGSDKKLQKAQEAARCYIDSISEEEWASIAAFSSSGHSVVELLPVKTGRERLKQGVFSLSASTSTNIGAGLEVGLNQLFLAKQEPKEPIILLLSDGMHNTGQLWPSVEKCRQKKVKVYTVAFGSDADQATLCKIAQQTGGRCSPAGLRNLSHVYHKVNIYAHNSSTLFASSDWLRPEKEHIYKINVPSDFKNLTFFSNWQGSSVQTSIVKPDGFIIHPSSQIGSYQKGETYSIFKIPAEPGLWEVRLKGFGFPPGGEQVNVSISGESEVYSNFLTFQPEYQKGQKVLIRAEVADASRSQKMPLENVKVKAKIEGPTPQLLKKVGEGKFEIDPFKFLSRLFLKQQEIDLYDDGAHDDYDARDGIYAATFLGGDVPGPYLVTLRIEGQSRGKDISRQIQESFQIGPIQNNKLTISDFIKIKYK